MRPKYPVPKTAKTVINCMNNMLTINVPWMKKARIKDNIELISTMIAEIWKDVVAKISATMTFASLILGSDLLRCQ